jgi:hypothetical protein
VRGEGGCVGVQNSGCVTGGEGGHPVERVLAATAATRCQPGSNNHHGGSGGMTWREHTLVGVYSGSSRAASPTSLNITGGACSNSWWFRAVAGHIFPPPPPSHTHTHTHPLPHPPTPPTHPRLFQRGPLPRQLLPRHRRTVPAGSTAAGTIPALAMPLGLAGVTRSHRHQVTRVTHPGQALGPSCRCCWGQLCRCGGCDATCCCCCSRCGPGQGSCSWVAHQGRCWLCPAATTTVGTRRHQAAAGPVQAQGWSGQRTAQGGQAAAATGAAGVLPRCWQAPAAT